MSRRRRNNIYPSGSWKQIFVQLRGLYLGTFEWKGLPDSVNTRYLEYALFEFGQVAIFKDEGMNNNILALQSGNSGSLNTYYEPTQVNIIGGNGFYRSEPVFSQFTKKGNAVLLWDNVDRYIPKLRLIDFAKRIALCERTIDLNVFAQRTPVTLTTDGKQLFSVQNMYRDYENFSPVIIKDDAMSERNIQVVDTKAPVVFDKIEEQKRKLWNEALAYIGIESNFSEKNERLVANEVLLSNGLAIAQRQQRLKARESILPVLDEAFGLKYVTVTVNNLSVLDFQGEKGDEENVNSTKPNG